MKFQGVVPPMVTLLDENRQIDYPANEKLIEYLIENGVDGLLILGTCGEFFAFSEQERQDFVSFVVKTVRHRVPVLVGTGHTELAQAVRFTQYTQQAGADAVLVISPYYVTLDENALYHYYCAVAHAADIPVLFYNFPERTGVNIQVPLVKRVMEACPNVCGMKDTMSVFAHTRSFISDIKEKNPDFCVFSGCDEYFFMTRLTGGNGVIGALSNFAPMFYSTLYASFQKCDFSLANECQRRIGILMELSDVSVQFIAVVKYAVSLVLDINPMPAAPFDLPTPDEQEKIKEILIRAGIPLKGECPASGVVKMKPGPAKETL